MKRPLFAVMAGLVLGEALFLAYGRTGLILEALLLPALVIYAMSRGRKGLFVPAACLVLSMTAGSLLILSASFSRGTDCILYEGSLLGEPLSSDGVKGTLTGRIRSVRTLPSGGRLLELTGRGRREGFKTGGNGSGSEGRNYLRLCGACAVFVDDDVTEILYPGDRVRLSGVLYSLERPANPGAFDARSYNLSRGIRSTFSASGVHLQARNSFSPARVLYRIKCHLGGVLRSCMEPEKAALLEAMLIGDKTGLTRSQKRLYEENGMAHLLTVSGLHVTIAAGRLFRFLRRKGISYRAAFLAGAAALLFYSLLTGSGNSVIRAGLMYMTFLTAELFGASYDMISAMCLAGILMLFDCPLRILDGGCMISFASVFTLGGLMPAADRLASAGRKPGKIGRALLGGLVFAGGTMPLLLRCFYQYAPYSILLNLIVLPLMVPLMISGLLALLAGTIWLPAGRLICLPAGLILDGYRLAFTWVRKLPASLIVTGCPSVPAVLFLYLAFFAAFYLWLKKKTVLMAAFILLVSGISLMIPSKRLGITMLDIGQGDCILLRLPGGESMLIDGGSTSRENIGENVILPALRYYGITKLDYIVCSHMDEDHISGVRELLTCRFPVGTLFLPGADRPYENQAEEKLIALSGLNGTKISYLIRGDRIRAGPVSFLCLNPGFRADPEDENSYSLVLYMSYGDFTGLFTGDLGNEQEDRMLSQTLLLKNLPEDLTLLKVGHHGSRYSTKESLLARFHPADAFISAGRHNRYGHPDPEVLDRLEKEGSRILVTADNGAIILETDGKRTGAAYYRDLLK